MWLYINCNAQLHPAETTHDGMSKTKADIKDVSLMKKIRKPPESWQLWPLQGMRESLPWKHFMSDSTETTLVSSWVWWSEWFLRIMPSQLQSNRNSKEINSWNEIFDQDFYFQGQTFRREEQHSIPCTSGTLYFPKVPLSCLGQESDWPKLFSRTGLQERRTTFNTVH